MDSQEPVAEVEEGRDEVAELRQTLKETVDALVALKGVVERLPGVSRFDHFTFMQIDDLRRKI